MADEFTNELAQAAQRLAAALRPKTPAGLTIKLVSGDIKSVATDGSSAVVDVGEGDINALNKSGDRLAAGESVWLGYTKNLADAVILFRAGISKPGVGEDLGNGNERFNDYVNNTTDGGSGVQYNTLKGCGNTVEQGAARNLIGGSNNQTKGGAADNIISGSYNEVKDGTSRTIVAGEHNTVGANFSDGIISGTYNSAAAGGGQGNAFIGRNASISGSANGNVVGGWGNSFSSGTFNDNAVFGDNNTLTSGGNFNIVGGYGNSVRASDGNLVAGNQNDATMGEGSIVGGMSNHVRHSAIAGGYSNYACDGSIAVGRYCEAGADTSQSRWDVNMYCAAFGYKLKCDANYVAVFGTLNDTSATTGQRRFVIGVGTEVGNVETRENGFEVHNDGNVYAKGSYNTLGADYAEYEEWLDGNLDNEDRTGHFVTYEGSKIRYANADDDYILGVVSATPSVIGDADIGYWRKRFVTDIFGRIVTEEIEVTRERHGESGNTETYKEMCIVPKISAEYDPEQAYIPRAERAEWSAVGTHGKLIVIDDGTCVVNGYCRPTDGGIGTAAMTGNGAYRVIERLDSTHVRIRII